jgi:hypothetical protein
MDLPQGQCAYFQLKWHGAGEKHKNIARVVFEPSDFRG